MSLRLLLLATCCHGALAAPLRVTLTPQAVLATRAYTLGDIAHVSGGAPGQAAALAALALGTGPRPGDAEQLARAPLQRLVRSSAPHLAPEWDGAAAVQLETVGQPLPAERLLAAATAYLEQLLARPDTRLRLQLAQALPPLMLPAGRSRLHVRALDPVQALRPQVAVWVDIYLDEVFYATRVVHLNLQAERPALVLRSALAKGTALGCADLETRVLDVAALGAPIADANCAAIAGRFRTRQTLAAGVALLQTQLQPLHAVEQGELVQVRLDAGAVQLESQAVALDGGMVGQTIMVRPNGADAAVAARVVTQGLVEITRRAF